ncbi:MAG: tetratricopeptide repeat protein [Chitinophagia bacterium]|nr:tetratricopeptide repeat protein [Chitinophagia bacterium]
MHANKYFNFVIWATACIAILLLGTIEVGAQTNMFLNKGNSLYEKGKYNDAAAAYLKALKKDPNNPTGLFNLGNSLYQQKQYDSSRKVMASTAGKLTDKKGQAAVNYNIGNTYMAQRKWEDAINAYKKTLRNNPQDPDAKYNLAYAKAMLKKEQQQSGGGKDDKKNKDKDKDKQDKNNKQDDKKDKQDQQQDPNSKDQQKQPDQQQGQQPSKLTQQQAEQLLNALQQEEKKLQDKLKKEKGVPVKLDKDW